MKIKQFISLILLLSAQIGSYAQEPNLDSLKQIWSNESLADTSRLEAMYQLIKKGYESNQPDSALFYANIQYQFAAEKGLQKHTARALNTQGVAWYNKGDYVKAIDYYTQSLEICKQIDYKKGTASVHNNMGLINEIQGNYIKAKDHYLRCLSILEEMGDRRASLAALNNLAVVFSILGDYTKAITYNTQCLKIAEEMGASKIELTLLNNIGLVYQEHKNYKKAVDYFIRGFEIAESLDYKPGMAFTLNNIGSVYELQEDHTQALSYFGQSLKIREEIDDQQGIVNCLANMGTIYTNTKKYTSSIDFQKRALRIAERIGYNQGIATSLNNLGIVHAALGNQSKALHYSTKALVQARETGAVIQIKSAAETLYGLYKKMGNYKSSLAMQELFITLRDSLEDVEVQKEVVRQEVEYNYQKQALADSIAFTKQRELDEVLHKAALDKETNRRYALLSSFVLVLIFLGIYFRIRFIKKTAEKEALIQEIKLLKADAFIKMASRTDHAEHPILDKEKIEAAIQKVLNPSDWNILNALYNNPSIGNRELADEVALSVAGVRSSLQKMYRYFYIEKSANQRVILVMEATKISNDFKATA